MGLVDLLIPCLILNFKHAYGIGNQADMMSAWLPWSALVTCDQCQGKSKHLSQFSSNVLGDNLDILLQVSKPFWSLVGKEVARGEGLKIEHFQ